MGLLIKDAIDLYHAAKDFEDQGNYIKAIECYTKAASKKFLYVGDFVNQSEVKLGEIYYNGKGVPQDNSQAFYWYKRAAEHGDISSMKWVGYFYDHGIGTNLDTQSAYYWYSKTVEECKRITNDPNSNDYTVKSHIEHVKWILKYHLQGNDYSVYYTWCDGLLYRNITIFIDEIAVNYLCGSDGYPQDYNMAFYCFHKASECGDNDATVALGDMYMNGCGVQADPAKALECYYKIAQKDMMDDDSIDDEIRDYMKDKACGAAEFSMYNCYRYGYGVEPDIEAAVKWLIKACKNDNAAAQFEYGSLLYESDIVEQNYSLSFKWISRSIELSVTEEQPMAPMMLAEMYLFGQGTDKDLDEAKKNYELSKSVLVSGLNNITDEEARNGINGLIEVIDKRLMQINNIFMTLSEDRYYNDELDLGDFDSLVSEDLASALGIDNTQNNNYSGYNNQDNSSYSQDHDYSQQNNSNSSYYSVYNQNYGYNQQGNRSTMNDLYADFNTSVQNTANSGAMDDLYSDFRSSSVQKNNDYTDSSSKDNDNQTPVQSNTQSSRNIDAIYAIGGVIEQIVNLKGISIFNDAKFFLNIFSDLAPQYKAERMQLEFAFSGGIADDILNTAISDEVKLNRIKIKIHDIGMNDEIVEKLSLGIAVALKWNVKIK